MAVSAETHWSKYRLYLLGTVQQPISRQRRMEGSYGYTWRYFGLWPQRGGVCAF